MFSRNSNSEKAPKTLKIFISYSRKDGVFAEELRTALNLVGFEAYLDKVDIAPGEPWEARLGSLIREADTVVFLLTPDSLASEHCNWEVEETARAGKRLVPVILKQVPEAAIPERLRELNFVFFRPEGSFSKALGNLVDALRADAGWIREHTRYGELAARWIEHGKAEALLLRGSDLVDAKCWMAERPAEAPEISAHQLAYIDASEKSAQDELKAKAALRSRILAGLAAVSVALAAFAAVAGIEWQKAESVTVELAKTNARLERKLGLRAGPFANKAYDVPPGWFQIATIYASAVAFLELPTVSGTTLASGAIMNARELNPNWKEGPVLLTARHVIPGSDAMALRPGAKATLVFFGPHKERLTVRVGEVLWQSDKVDVSISKIEGQLPDGVTMISNPNRTPSALAGVPNLSKADLQDILAGKDIENITKRVRPIVLIGRTGTSDQLTLSLSHLLSAAKLSSDGAEEAMPGGDLIYAASPPPGSSGSPIFDAATGEMIGIHLYGYTCPASQLICTQGGNSLPRILEAIRGSEVK